MSGGVWRATALASLAVNLLVFGAVIGGYAAGARFEPPRPAAAEGWRGRGAGPERALAALTPEERASLRRALAQTWRGAEGERDAARAARMAVLEAVSAEPYDASRVSEALRVMREADVALQAAFHDAMATALADVAPERRAAALRALSRRGGGDGRGGPPASN